MEIVSNVDRQICNENVQNALSTFHLDSNIRYSAICFHAESMKTAEAIKECVTFKLSNYDVWLDVASDSTPKFNISRKGFEKAILNENNKGLIIYKPEDWMTSWSSQEKQSFWSFLSMLHGRRPIVIVNVGGDKSEFRRLTQRYLVEQAMNQIPASVWVSIKA